MPDAVGAGGRRLLRTPLVPLLGGGGGGLVRVDAGAGELLPRDSGRVRANDGPDLLMLFLLSLMSIVVSLSSRV